MPVFWFTRRPVLRRKMGECAEEFGFGLRAGTHVMTRDFDVWHALGTADAAAATLLSRARRLRSVYTTLGIPSHWYRESRPDRRLHELVVGHADSYVCLSEAAGRALQSGWRREPAVIGGGVDLRRFTPGRRHKRPTLFYAGTLDDPRKNVALLIEAAGVLRRQIPELELWISGPGDLKALIGQASDSGREAVVDVGIGDPEQHAARYAEAWVTVLPSVDEAFGLCLVESLAAGTPIVVLEGSGGPAEIARPGVGYRSSPSVSALAEACAQALDLAQTAGIAECCREEASRYDWRTSIVPQLESVYFNAGLSS